MSEIKLLPCPVCGGEVQYHSWSHTMENFFNKNTIICPTCDFAMEDVSEIRLIKKWNTRKPMQEMLRRLERENEHSKRIYGVTKDNFYLGMCQAREQMIQIILSNMC